MSILSACTIKRPASSRSAATAQIVGHPDPYLRNAAIFAAPGTPKGLLRAPPFFADSCCRFFELETNEETIQEPANVLHSTDDPLLVQHEHLATPVFDALEVEEAKARLEGPGKDQFHVRGHID